MHDLFTAVAVITILAATLVFLLTRLKQSAIVAYIVLGVLCSVFGLIPPGETISHLSELGVVFLLFFIGLEFEAEHLKKVARLATIGTLIQVGATAAVVGGASMLIGFSFKEALVAGVAAGLSSTAIVLKAFQDTEQSDSAAAQASLAVLLGQDLVALLFVAALPLIVGAPPNAHARLSPGLSLIVMMAAMPVLFFGARKVLPPLFNKAAIARNPEVFALCSLGACLFVAILAREAGASLALGAFMGGLVFSGTPFAHQIRADLVALKNLSLGFFFVTVGMMMDLRFVADHVPLLVLGLVFIVVAKALVAAGVFRSFRMPWSVAAAGGVALAQVSEFAFVLTSAAQQSGAFTTEHHQAVVTLSVLTMLVAPALVSRSQSIGLFVGTQLFRSFEPPPPPSPNEEEEVAEQLAEAAQTRAIVVGYGPVGLTLCKILIRFGLRPCVIDLNLDTVKKLEGIGRDAVFGDATNREVLHAAGIDKARYLLITTANFQTRAAVAAVAQALNPKVAIVSRARFLDEKDSLSNAGASHIAFEECEVAAELARLILRELGARPERLQHEVTKLRNEIATRTGFTVLVPRTSSGGPGASLLWSAIPAAPTSTSIPRGESSSAVPPPPPSSGSAGHGG